MDKREYRVKKTTTVGGQVTYCPQFGYYSSWMPSDTPKWLGFTNPKKMFADLTYSLEKNAWARIDQDIAERVDKVEILTRGDNAN